MPKQSLNHSILEAAILGFEAQKKNIDVQIAELKAMLSGGFAKTTATSEAAPRKRKAFSAASRRKMALAQKARWAKLRSESQPAPATAKPAKKKRKLSAAGKAAIVAALRKRWALKKAAVKKAVVKAPTKKAKKSAPIKKAVPKKTAPAAAKTASETAAQ